VRPGTAVNSRIAESESVSSSGSPVPASRPLSLLLICRSYPPVLGGSEVEAQRVCAALIQRGHRVTVLCAGGKPMPDVKRWTDPAGVPVRIIGGRVPSRLRDYAFALGVAWSLIRERRNYQTAYFLMQGLHLAVGLPVARFLRKQIVMKVSGSSIITLMREHWLGRMELRFLRKWARTVMVLNPGIEREAIEAGLERSQLTWMPNPVDDEQFAPCGPKDRREIRRSLALSEDARVVLFVGRLAPEKELPSLLRAFAAVRSEHPDARLVLIGDGPSGEALKKLTQQLRIADAVTFTGRLETADVVRWLRASDVFALVSSNEGFPCSLAEAMCAGLPAVASDIPGNTQLIEPMETGLLTRAGDSRSIAEALGRLLRDERLRRRLGTTARERVAGAYSVGKITELYEQLLRETRGPVWPERAPHEAGPEAGAEPHERIG
jgi:glycosyltransferase involved in cell wall biosynthesis